MRFSPSFWSFEAGRDIPQNLRGGGRESVLTLAVLNTLYASPRRGRAFLEKLVELLGKQIELLEKLIEMGADVDRKDIRGCTSLMRVAETSSKSFHHIGRAIVVKRQIALIDLLIRGGAEVDARDARGETALSRAAAAGGTEVVRRLLEAGADVNARDDDGTSVLMKALTPPYVDADVLMLMLDSGVAPESLRDGRSTALTLAMHQYVEVNGDYDPIAIATIPISVIEKLLTFEWSQTEKDDALVNSSPAFTLNIDRIEMLVKHGADVNARDAAGKNVLMKYLSEGRGRKVSVDLPERLIELGFDVSARADDGGTLLTMGAGVEQSPEFLSCLLKAGADVGARDDRGRTCLCVDRPAASAKVLLDAGADADAVADDGMTPLHVATSPDVLSLLISAGADPNRRDHDGRTPLLVWMQENRDPAGIQRFLDAGADVRTPDHAGTTPLMSALANDRYSSFAVPFLERGADPNAKRFDGQTPLMLIARQATGKWHGRGYRLSHRAIYLSRGLAEKIDALLAWGADADERDLSGRTARDHAGENADPKMVELLARATEKVRQPRPLGRTALMLAALRNDIDARLPEDATPESADHYGWTALMHAAWGNPNPEMTRLLIGRGADVNARDHLGRTPLMLAAWRNPSVGVLEALVEAGALLNLRDLSGDSAVKIAIARDRPAEVLGFFFDVGAARTDGKRFASDMLLATSAVTSRPEVLHMLLDRGTPVDARGPDGQTPLMKAVSRNRRPGVVRVLLDAGADVDAKDDRGISVLDYALRNDEAVWQLLLEAGIEQEEESVWWADWEKKLLLSRPEKWKSP
ncbi:MAG: ankyrin repeat domain-containing protein [Synergistaceae bacterium]|jgi:ankyrin repeat protein|nr:ankyrin repeat domain-containing protein [Synergistaceae bacterium]